MNLWVSVVLVLLAQEAFTTNAVLSQALANHLSLWVIHAIFTAATTIDICVGFIFGKILQKFASRSARIRNWCNKVQQRADRILNRGIERYGLFAFGTVAQPYITSFVGSWLDLTFGEIFVVAFLSDIIWYLCSLGIVFGMQAILPVRYTLVGVIVATALLVIIFRVFRKSSIVK